MYFWLFLILPLSCVLFLYNCFALFKKIHEGKKLSIRNIIFASVALYLMIFIPAEFIAAEAGRAY
ncbi:PCZ2-2 [Paenibacillus typhae]|uniref:Uncharacterized protein n=1 Tax=Paenibacillus typhae TaxID=1174501 RepID=A0A1G8V2I2_9BACL|nr:hypothetical protein SAMN05216192_12025 [Paenibacillus typhae]